MAISCCSTSLWHEVASCAPVGASILLDAESWIGADGPGLAMARLADISGYFGSAIQSLVIEKRQTANAG